MKKKTAIKQIIKDDDLTICSSIIQKSFLTVAKDLNLTKENAPTNPAFITYEKLKEEISKKSIKYFGFFLDKKTLSGCVAIEKADNNLYYMERLAVLPEYRHNGFGKLLVDFAFDYVKDNGGIKISIGIINENYKLKKWYLDYGFQETGIKKFDHLPFTVCFLEKDICNI